MSTSSPHSPVGELRMRSPVMPILLLAATAGLFLNGQFGEPTPAPSSMDWEWTWHQLNQTLKDIPLFFAAQWAIVWKLLLWSLIPGLAGLIYRRSFMVWFFLAFVILYAINQIAPLIPPEGTFGSLIGTQASGLRRSYNVYLAIEVLLIVPILAFRLSYGSWRLVDVIGKIVEGTLNLLRSIFVEINIFWDFLKSAPEFISEANSLKAWFFVLLKLLFLVIGSVVELVFKLVLFALMLVFIVLYLGLLPIILILTWRPTRDINRAYVEKLANTMREGVGSVDNALDKLKELPNIRPLVEKAFLKLSGDTEENGMISTEHAKNLDQAIKIHFSKNIVVCLDGTWNEPGQLDFGHHAETNVLKLFRLLKDQEGGIRSHYNSSLQSKFEFKNPKPDELDSTSKNSSTISKRHISDSEGRSSGLRNFSRSIFHKLAKWQFDQLNAIWAKIKRTKQLAFYYRGVGNKAENNPLTQMFGGAFGLGAAGIIDRAYMDVARVWKPGDRIFIFGFSRGAAAARLLAGVLGRRGVPNHIFTLRLFGRHFPVWKSASRRDQDDPIKVDVLGCWDTVGAFGISKDILGIPFQKINLLKDLSISPCVKRAYHMVALDETRDAFVPTLMDRDPIIRNRVIEVWFAGNHSNVGGGYATDKLSDVTLAFLLKRVSSDYVNKKTAKESPKEHWGLYLNDNIEINPDPGGRIRQSTGPIYKHIPREMPLHAIIHKSVFKRMEDPESKYMPQSLIDLNRRFLEERYKIKTALHQMKEDSTSSPENTLTAPQKDKDTPSTESEAYQLPLQELKKSLPELERYLKQHSTGALNNEQFERAMEWANDLKMKKWSDEEAADVKPEVELKNQAAE